MLLEDLLPLFGTSTPTPPAVTTTSTGGASPLPPYRAPLQTGHTLRYRRTLLLQRRCFAAVIVTKRSATQLSAHNVGYATGTCRQDSAIRMAGSGRRRPTPRYDDQIIVDLFT